MPGSVKALRLQNLLVAGSLTGSQLETELGLSLSLSAWNAALGLRKFSKTIAASSTAMASVIASPTAMASVIASPTAMASVAASSTAMTAVAASSTAMTAVIASSTAMAAVIASSTAMTAVAASSTAMTAVIASSTAMAAVAASSTAMAAVAASSTARTAIYNSDTALLALENVTTRNILRSLTQYVSLSISNTSSSTAKSLTLTGNAIIFEIAASLTSQILTIAGRRAGSAQGVIAAYNPPETALPGDRNVLALTSAATVATNATSANTSFFGLIYV
jgi:hypothetical protein